MTQITAYFNAVRAESLLFIAVGRLALALAGWAIFWSHQPLWRGAAGPLAAVAVLQLAVGITVWQRSPLDITRVKQIVQQAPEKVRTEEIARTATLMVNFERYRWIEITLVLAAACWRRWRGPARPGGVPGWHCAGPGRADAGAGFFCRGAWRRLPAWLQTQ